MRRGAGEEGKLVKQRVFVASCYVITDKGEGGDCLSAYNSFNCHKDIQRNCKRPADGVHAAVPEGELFRISF